ncbi:hypothetical protein [Streptomyces sp. NPDC001604]|uniref:hypothetical protein n=1 Tax=Streptomyces sp. NPDC001604 TaxID=3364593 RepID=UPI0036CCD4EE
MRTGGALRAGAVPGCAYGGYRTMDPPDGRHDILRDVVNTTTATRKRQRAQAAHELIGRRAAEGCRDRYRSGSPSRRAWQ